MYICTFYSFKGGVGRSLALVNVAAQFALSGKRVLLVDFDLEAPGLDTFDLLQSNANTPGIVDYVQKYLKANRVPNVLDYVAQSKFNDQMYLMPSGDAKQNYATKAFQIDWKDLYANRDGYLLFEDMKAQWQKELQPDYVFIDSRTGYSDTSGICTRQLPDSVVVLFFPNEQNLRGISKVVTDIRSEADSMRQRDIALHFVMSNVPFLDDEEEIIQDFQQRFAEALEFSDCHVIHRYDSLPLLQQSVFVAERPNSRLTKEYQFLAKLISNGNIADRSGALFRIEQYWNRLISPSKPNDIETAKQRVIDETNTLCQIHDYFPDDFEILFQLARLWKKGGNLAGSDLNPTNLVSDALKVAPSEDRIAQMLVTIAEDSQPDYEATKFVIDALDHTTTLEILKRAMDCLGGSVSFFDVDVIKRIAESLAISNLSIQDQFELAIYLERKNYLAYSNTVLSSIVERGDTESEPTSALSLLTRNQIAIGRFKDSFDCLFNKYSTLQKMSIIDAFNSGVASWGMRKKPILEPFSYVRDKIDKHYSEFDDSLPDDAWDYGERRFSTNPDQDFRGGDIGGMELWLWDFTGQDLEGLLTFEEYELAQIYIFCCWVLTEAGESLQRSDLLIREYGLSSSKRIFSYWQYKYVSFDEFQRDSLNMVNAIEGRNPKLAEPPFMERLEIF